ncbi:MAG TPA: hypothetical protein VHK69_10650 [Chitinophagaceae bacterium]|nr:hypothetical protein [Chitinophagaceae bacterium]
MKSFDTSHKSMTRVPLFHAGKPVAPRQENRGAGALRTDPSSTCRNSRYPNPAFQFRGSEGEPRTIQL